MIGWATKGEMTAKQIIAIIILIVSFSVILIFFFMLNLTEESEIEACHSSVVWRNMLKGLGKLAVKYQCKTQDIVIDQTEPQEIYAELAEAQRDCFWMIGEGEIDLGDDVCAICSIIDFDDKAENITNTGYYTFLENNLLDSGESYLAYFYGLESFEAYEQTYNLGHKMLDTSQKHAIYFQYNDDQEPLITLGKYNSETVTILECSSFVTTL